MRFLPALPACLWILAAVLPASAWAVDWEKLEKCTLKAAGGNDGDSFHVLHNGKEYIFRLYFVDTPETSSNFPDRVKEQANYFHLEEKDTLKLGHEAETFTRNFLHGENFTVHTAWEDAKGESALPRYYALVEKDSRSLIEALAEAGLVRIHGMPTRGNKTPLDSGPDRYISKLKRLENAAQRDHLGGWKKNRLEIGEAKEMDLTATTSTPALAAGSTVNVNTATPEELDHLPGIGPVLAQRIIEGRSYEKMDDLVRVQGIGPALLEKLKPSIRLRD